MEYFCLFFRRPERKLCFEAREFLNRNVGLRCVMYYRECNNVAHSFVNEALLLCESQSWFAIAPEFIRDRCPSK